MGTGTGTFEVEEGEGDELELVVARDTEVVEGGEVLVLLGGVLVEDGFGCSVVVVVGTGLLPKDQDPYMTP